MKTTRKTIALMGLSTALVLGVAVVAVSQNNNFAKAETCSHAHLGHYDRVNPTVSSNGHIEYWVCCDCHNSYNVDPTKQSQAVLIENAAGNPTDDGDGRCIPKMSGNAQSIETPNLLEFDRTECQSPANKDPRHVLDNYETVYSYDMPTDSSSASTYYLGDFDLTPYQEISFGVLYCNDGSYLKASKNYSKGAKVIIEFCAGIKTQRQGDAKYWHEIRLINNGVNYSLYLDGALCSYENWNSQLGRNEMIPATLDSNLNEVFFGLFVRGTCVYSTEIKGVLKNA